MVDTGDIVSVRGNFGDLIWQTKILTGPAKRAINLAADAETIRPKENKSIRGLDSPAPGQAKWAMPHLAVCDGIHRGQARACGGARRACMARPQA